MKNNKTLVDFFEESKIDYKDQNSSSFKKWTNTLIPEINNFKKSDIFIEKLLQRNSYKLFSIITKQVTLFTENLQFIINTGSYEQIHYFSVLLINDHSFRSKVVKEFAFAFYIKDLLKHVKNKIFIENDVPIDLLHFINLRNNENEAE